MEGETNSRGTVHGENKEGEAEPGEARPWGILIVDDHPVFRLGMREFLSSMDLAVVGEAANGYQALDAVRTLKPDLVLMDVEMPDMNGLEALRRIKGEAPGVIVVMLTAFANEAYLIKAAVNGASGFILKGDDPVTFHQTLLDILEGKSAPAHDWWRAALGHVRASAPANRPGSATPPPFLTPKELAILRHFACGRSSDDVTEREQIQGVTLRKHCTKIYRKLGVSDRMQAVLKGIREGWLCAEGPEETGPIEGEPLA